MCLVCTQHTSIQAAKVLFFYVNLHKTLHFLPLIILRSFIVPRKTINCNKTAELNGNMGNEAEEKM